MFPEPWRPVQPSESKCGRNAEPCRSGAYAEDAFNPKTEFQIESVGTIRGRLRRLVTLHPVKIQPGEGKIQPHFSVRGHLPPPERSLSIALRESFALVVPQKFAPLEAVKRFARWKESMGYES